jgi:hypothetical protein
MAACYIHILPFSIVAEKLEIGVFHGKKPEFCFIPRVCMLEAFCLGYRQPFFPCPKIVEILGCEI